VLWVTPLRALANDTAQTLTDAAGDLVPEWMVELRTGDSPSSLKKRHRSRLPSVLVTTPESLCLMLSYPETAGLIGGIRCLVMDEWHELMGSKRGVQAQLCAAHLKRLNPEMRIWGVSATLGNLDEAMDALLGEMAPREQRKMIHGEEPKPVVIDSLLPPEVERFPWAGHLGTRMLPQVLEAVEAARATLIFTNTRSQAEIWFSRIVRERPQWIGTAALHHGSLDREVREEVEGLLRAGKLRCVVCTSSLDLGVDFSPVDQVIQIGSPRGVARLLQRAGRSGHQPGAVSRVLCVPTNAMELLDISAARAAAGARRIERRTPVRMPMDVLVQHLVTMAAGSGFDEATLRREVCSTHAFGGLSDEEWDWAMGFVSGGGPALGTYPEYSRIVRGMGQTRAVAARSLDGSPTPWPPPSEGGGRCEDASVVGGESVDRDLRTRAWTVASEEIARMHRGNIGTITADGSVTVKFAGGRVIGSVEEGFIARVPPGGTFVFAGRLLELVRVREQTAIVTPAKRTSGIVPRWNGSRMQLSTELADAVRARLEEARGGILADAEMRLAAPLLALQAKWSVIPARGQLLIEQTCAEDGHHAFLYPFDGRTTHEGLSAIVAYRITQREPQTVLVSATDAGFEIASATELNLDVEAWRAALSPENLLEDLFGAVNVSVLARRAFREIARVAGLVMQGFGKRRKGSRQLLASSGLFFDVFNEFDPRNLLLDQARREVLEGELDFVRLRGILERLAEAEIVLVRTPAGRFTPLAFPIWAESLRTHQISSEQWSNRVRRMVVDLEDEADDVRDDDPRNGSETRDRSAASERRREGDARQAKPERTSHRMGGRRMARAG